MKVLILFQLCLLMSFNVNAQTIYVTGELESRNTQHILMPLVPSFNGKISEMAAEGTFVKEGDLLVRIDGATLDSQLITQEEDLITYTATAKKDAIEFKIQLNAAQIAFEVAKINFEIAAMQAETPLDFIGELKYKQNQLELKNSEKIYKKTVKDLQEQKIIIANDKKKYALGIVQKQKKLDYLQSTLEAFNITAKQEGYIVYSVHPHSGEKFQEGDQAQTGFRLMSVAQNNDMQIIATINAIDIPRLEINQKVTIKFDAFLENSYSGEIIKISSGGSDKQVWGDALYYQATIAISDVVPNDLLIGMSAQVAIKFKEKKQ
jgi:multidrug resistance efflux pump